MDPDDITSHLLDTSTTEPVSLLKRKVAKKEKQQSNPSSQSERTVLEEGEYTSALSKIIERDFFPDLPKLRAQVDYQNAYEDKEEEKPLSKKLRVDDMSLDKFQGQYTSEDNASFNEIMNEEKKRREKPWLNKYQKRLTSGTAEQKLITGGSSDPKRLEFWNLKSKNTLMNVPEATGSNLKPTLEEKKIIYANTRLPQPAETTETSSEKAPIGSDALRRLKQSNLMTPHIQPQPSATPVMNLGYSLVEATPTIEPQTGGATPALTFGFIESTPVLLDKSEDVKPLEQAFRVPEIPKRDQLGQKLSEDARRKTKKPAQSSLPAGHRSGMSNQERLRMLSPAARSLFAKTQSPSVFSGGTGKPSTPATLPGKTPIIKKE